MSENIQDSGANAPEEPKPKKKKLSYQKTVPGIFRSKKRGRRWWA